MIQNQSFFISSFNSVYIINICFYIENDYKKMMINHCIVRLVFFWMI